MKSLLIAGLDVRPVRSESLIVANCDGSVRIDSCTLPGITYVDPATSQAVIQGSVLTGTLSWTYTAPALGMGAHLPLHIQSGEVTGNGQLTLGPARVIHLLNSMW